MPRGEKISTERLDRGEMPVGGWQPALDDEGRPIPSPPPSEPTDVSEEEVERAKRETGEA